MYRWKVIWRKARYRAIESNNYFAFGNKIAGVCFVSDPPARRKKIIKSSMTLLVSVRMVVASLQL